MRTDVSTDEVEDIVGGLAASEGSSGEPSAPTKRRRRVSREPEPVMPSPVEILPEEPTAEPEPQKARAAESAAGPERTVEQLEADMLRPSVDLPRPAENVKTLGDLVANYEIGQRPDFKLHLFRLWPKLFSGNRKADGFYAEFEHPIDESFIANEYGGGTYRVAVMGPHPKSPTGQKHYNSVRIDIAGPPREDNLPRTERKADGDGHDLAQQQQVQPPPYHVHQQTKDDPKIVATVLDAATKMADAEREERHRLEARNEKHFEAAQQMYAPVLESERKRADEVTRLEREKGEIERRSLESRLELERQRQEDRVRELEAKLEEERARARDIERRAVDMEASRPSVGQELERILPYVQRKGDEGGSAALQQTSEMAKEMLSKQSEQHRLAVEAMRSSYERQIGDMRASQEASLQAMREAHTREVAAERESGRNREQRFEDSLRAEREERRRDQDRHREQLAERDQMWKDRLEQQELNLKAQWESRLTVIETSKTERISWLEREIDRKQQEVNELKAQLMDQRDPVSFMAKMAEIKQGAVTSLGLVDPSSQPAPAPAPAAPPSGLAGIDPTEALETIVEEGPKWIEALGNVIRGGGGGGQAQQPYPGQVVQTPQGPMVVVQTPQGLMLTPQVQQQAPQQQLLPAGQGRPAAARRTSHPRQAQPVAQPSAQQQQGAPRRRQRADEEDADIVPNLAEDQPGLPPIERRQAPWEKRRRAAAAQRQSNGAVHGAPAVPPAAMRAAPPPAPQPNGEVQMNLIEKQIAKQVARLVDESVSEGDEPQDFVQKVLGAGYPEVVVRGICEKSDQEIIAGIMTVDPQSAGATPAGQRFVREAMSLLRQAAANAG